MKNDYSVIILIPNKFKIFFQLLITISLIIVIIPYLFGLDEFLGTQKGDISKIAKILFLIGSLFLMLTKDKNEDELLEKLRFRSILYAIIATVVVYISIIILETKSWNTFYLLSYLFVVHFISFYLIQRRHNKQ